MAARPRTIQRSASSQQAHFSSHRQIMDQYSAFIDCPLALKPCRRSGVISGTETIRLLEAVTGLKRGSKTDSIGSCRIKLTWNKVPGATSYIVYRSVDGAEYTEVCSTESASYLATDGSYGYNNIFYSAGHEYRFYVVLGGKKLIGPELYTDLMMDYWLNDPFYDFEIVDINPPGFDTSWDW